MQDQCKTKTNQCKAMSGQSCVWSWSSIKKCGFVFGLGLAHPVLQIQKCKSKSGHAYNYCLLPRPFRKVLWLLYRKCYLNSDYQTMDTFLVMCRTPTKMAMANILQWHDKWRCIFLVESFSSNFKQLCLLLETILDYTTNKFCNLLCSEIYNERDEQSPKLQKNSKLLIIVIVIVK